jgi:hypothetical protein
MRRFCCGVAAFLLFIPGWTFLAAQASPPPIFSIQVTNKAVTIEGTTSPGATMVLVCKWSGASAWTSSNGKCTGSEIVAEYPAPVAGSPAPQPVGFTPDATTGNFSAPLASDMCTNGTYFSVYYEDRSGSPRPSLAASPCPEKGTKAATPSSTTSTLNVTLPYCDQSPPYAYSDTVQATTESIVVNVGIDSVNAITNIAAQMQQAFPKAQVTFPDPATAKLVLPSVAMLLRSPPQSLLNGGANDNPISFSKTEVQINDVGGPLLTSGSPQDFTNSTSDAQRLLVRTQFGPNFSRLACSYSYLTGTIPAKGAATDFKGNPENITASPANQAVSLIGPDAPQYYLFNIVRWSDAGSQGNAAAQSGSGSQPSQMYQADSEWYLLNYSDAKDKHRDLSLVLQKLPYFDQDTLNILGTSRVLFIGIHLAPPAKYSGPLPQTVPGIPLIPTEQAWYDTVSIHYKFSATSVDPVNVADLKTLISAVLGVSSSQTSNQAALAPSESERGGYQALTVPSTPTPIDLLKAALGQTVTAKGSIDCFIGDATPQYISITAPLYSVLSTVSEQSCHSLGRPTAISDSVAKLSSCLSDIQEANISGEIGAINPVATTVTSGLNDLMSNLSSGKAVQVYSTYQGLYAAGLLTNLTQLPQVFVGASNITGTWSASFSGGSPVAAAPATGAQQTAPSTTISLKSSNTQQKQKGTQNSAASTAKQTASAQTGPTSACDLSTTAGPNGKAVQETCTSTSQDVHDEGIAYWDVSVAVPVQGFRDVSFQTTTNASGASVYAPGPQSTTRENAYGMFDLFIIPPFGQDLYNPPVFGIPYVAAGLPFSGKVFDKPYFAAGEMINVPSLWSKLPYIGQRLNLGKILPIQLRPMYGWVWNKEFKTVPATAATSTIPAMPAHQVYLRRSLDPQFSIEVSIKSVASKLGKSSSGSGSGSKSGGTSSNK